MGCKGRMSDLISILNKHLIQENKQVYDDLGFKCVYQFFFWSKDGNFCQDIFLVFQGKNVLTLYKKSGHDFIWTAVVNTENVFL